MNRPRFDVRGAVIVITGGTGAWATRPRVKCSPAGKVAVIDVHPDTARIAARMSPDSAFGVVADVRDCASLDRAVTEIVDRFGGIDVAIANAGALGRTATVRTTPIEAIESVLAVNVTGVVNTVHACMDQILASRGHFALISSVFAFINGMGAVPYAMSKSAVEQLGRGLQVELAPHGVSTTIAYFSLIDTAMIRHGVDDDPLADDLLSAIPQPLLKRLTPRLPHPLSPMASHVEPHASRPRPVEAGLDPAWGDRSCAGSAPGTQAAPAGGSDRPRRPPLLHPERPLMTTWKDTPPASSTSTAFRSPTANSAPAPALPWFFCTTSPPSWTTGIPASSTASPPTTT